MCLSSGPLVLPSSEIDRLMRWGTGTILRNGGRPVSFPLDWSAPGAQAPLSRSGRQRMLGRAMGCSWALVLHLAADRASGWDAG